MGRKAVFKLNCRVACTEAHKLITLKYRIHPLMILYVKSKSWETKIRKDHTGWLQHNKYTELLCRLLTLTLQDSAAASMYTDRPKVNVKAQEREGKTGLPQ